MPTQKHESFSFGGVDSRSNPANFPPNRALRCLNCAPQASGSLRLRPGFTFPLGANGLGPIHSALYYEQFSAAYLGPQFVMYGNGTAIHQYAIGVGSDTVVGHFTTGNPWGHFRSGNRVFIADGVSNLNWDGSTLRTTGIPAVHDLASSTLSYAGTVVDTGGHAPLSIQAWVNPTNAQGAPGVLFTSATAPLHDVTNVLSFQNFGFAIPLGAPIIGMVVTVTAEVAEAGLPAGAGVVADAQVFIVSARLGPGQFMTFQRTGAPATASFGTPTSTAGCAVTAAILNNVGFGVNFFGTQLFSSSSSAFWKVYGCQITVYYAGAFGAVVSVTGSSLGSIAPTQLSGYQLYAAVYNPITQHMGNADPIGSLQTVGATLSAFQVSGLPALSGFNPEWEWALGMTNDGGQVPYWFIDNSGNDIILSNAATSGTVFLDSRNFQQQLPARNDVPLPFDKFARVGTRIFAGLAGNPFLSYSNDESDIANAGYVGKPEESWPADQQEPLPDGLLPRAIHAYRLEGWFFSRENLHIWSQFLLQQGVNPWRGPWPGGCAGQRAFIETPHGPFWLSAQKQLCTFMEDGVISVSDEYESTLLGALADNQLGSVELGYLLDQGGKIDEIMIRGLNSVGDTIIVVHDFHLSDERSPHGQAYTYQYGGLTPTTFVGAGYTPRQNVYDQNGKMRLWTGAPQGFAQLEDGLADNTLTYSADYIGLVGLGVARRSLVELEFQGDPNWQVSYLADYSLSAGDFIDCDNDIIPEDVQGGTRYGAKMTGEARWVYLRMRLTSHPADGNFAFTDPPFLPMPSYGTMNETILKLGAPRPEGR